MAGLVRTAVVISLAFGAQASLTGCGKKDEPAPPAASVTPAGTPATPAPAPAVVDSSRTSKTTATATPPAADSSARTASSSAMTGASGAADGSVCCDMVVNPALGRLGRLVIAFPEGADASGSHVSVHKPGENANLQSGYGPQAWDLIPGGYDLTLSGKRIGGVTIQSGHDTQLRVGTLRIKTGSSTAVAVMDADDKTKLTSGYGPQVIGLPVGTYRVKIAGQSEAVTIQKGKITDF